MIRAIKEKVTLVNIVRKCFGITYKLSIALLKISKSRIFGLLFLLCLLLMLISATSGAYKSLFCFMMGMYFVLWLSDAEKHLLSISGFLGMGFIYWFVPVFLVSVMLTKYIPNNWIKFYIVVCAIWCVTWCIYSMLASNKVANIANQIIATIFGILVIVKDLVITCLPDTYLEKVIVSGLTNEKRMEIVFNLLCSPILAINLLALLLCTLKGYWIEKYNDNKDIDASWFEEEEPEKIDNLI